MKNSFGISELSLIPIRKFPKEQSEMTTQILFGETFEILEKFENWIKIRISFDNYEGWMDKKMFLLISYDCFYEILENESKTKITRNAITKIYDKNNKFITFLSAGSNLNFFDKKDLSFKIGKKKFFLKKAENFKNFKKRDEIVNTAKKFLNSPYLWGGRSIFGFDSSGFTQIVYKINKINIPRDAYQQINLEEKIKFEEAKYGDLIFFQNKNKKIFHTGIMIENKKIIHCSGKVRIDKIDKNGIFDEEKLLYSHKKTFKFIISL